MNDSYVDVYGLHGTSKDIAEDIVCGGFDLSKDVYYGNGVYFYEDNPKGRLYACNWAEKKYDTVSIVKANLYCLESLYLDLTEPEVHLREVIKGLSKCGDNVPFNLAAKKILKLVLSDVERVKNTRFQLVKVLVPEGFHNGWDYGYVAKDIRIIKDQKILEL